MLTFTSSFIAASVPELQRDLFQTQRFCACDAAMSLLVLNSSCDLCLPLRKVQSSLHDKERLLLLKVNFCIESCGENLMIEFHFN